MISIKSDSEIDLMREAGKILAETHEKLKEFVKPGISTLEIDEYAKNIIEKHGATCSFYKLYDFPRNFCISLNEEVIHGIPKKDRILKDGDVLKIDGGVCYKGYHSDAARTHIIGNVSDEVRDLVERTEQSFYEGIKNAIIGNHIYDISAGIDDYISKFGYGIVEEYTGHGIGQKVHEDPDVPNYKTLKKGPILKKNMTLAVEPMITLGTYEIDVLSDEWTVVTRDKSISAHYENTIVITDNGAEILSKI